MDDGQTMMACVSTNMLDISSVCVFLFFLCMVLVMSFWIVTKHLSVCQSVQRLLFQKSVCEWFGKEQLALSQDVFKAIRLNMFLVSRAACLHVKVKVAQSHEVLIHFAASCAVHFYEFCAFSAIQLAWCTLSASRMENFNFCSWLRSVRQTEKLIQGRQTIHASCDRFCKAVSKKI